MNDTKVFSAKLSNGIEYELHESLSFSGRSEIALKIEGEVIVVIDTEVKRTGNIVCKPLMNKFLRIKKDPESIGDSPNSLDLDDVMGDDESEPIEPTE